MVTGRFAPSPTGDLHLGNLRTALIAWWWARSEGGEFRLRIEDLDPKTAQPQFEHSQRRDLESIGIDWDGPVLRQSDRRDDYRDAIADLDRAGLLYRCYCTRREIAQASSAPNAPTPHDGYPGTCRKLPTAAISRLQAEGRPPALRLRADHAVVEFVDEVHGGQHSEVDDVVVQRNDGVAAYNLAVVLDDAVQGVDLVVRGDDLLDSTPRQIHLGRLLGLPTPRYGHVPLVLVADRRMAKRDGAVTLADRVRLGDEPSAMVRWLAATLGLHLIRSVGADNGDLATGLAPDFVASFRPDALPRSPLVLAPEQLSTPLPWPA